MPRITVYFVDGTAQKFMDVNLVPRVDYKIGFVEVTDTYGRSVAYPAAQVKRVEMLLSAHEIMSNRYPEW